MNSQRHLEFHERQAEAMDGLTDALLPAIPRHWRHAQPELDVHYSTVTKTRAIHHRLTHPTTGEEVGDFPPDLFGASTTLHMVFTEYEQSWKRAIIELTFHENGSFRQRKANYTYGP